MMEVHMNILFLTAYRLTDKDTREKINEDSRRFLKWDEDCKGMSPLKRFTRCCREQEFRNVLRFRFVNGSPVAKLIGKIGFLFSPADKSVEIMGDIKGGLLVSHRFSAIFPKKAGKNLRVGPGVVIGRNGNDFPIIGNNVYIAANSTVIGGIKIGDNVIIGAGSVVTKDVPSNSVVVGNPARVIRPIEEKDLEEIT